MNETGRLLDNSSMAQVTNETLKVRLDTFSITEQIRIFLKGVNVVAFKEDGLIKYKEEQVGKAKCNAEGVQTLMNWITATLNPQVVQGNFPMDGRTGECKAYDDYIEEYNIELASLVITNVYNWDMEDNDIEGVINFIMFLIIPFMSRLIGNEERNSYNQTMRSVETSNTKEVGKKFPLFN